MFFADALPTSVIVPEQAVTIVIVFGCFLFFLNVGGAVLVIIGFSRRKPAIEAEFATKAEVRELRNEMKQDIGALFGKIDTLIASINHSTNDMQRDLGRIDSLQDLAKSIAEAIRK